jgi:isocitrate/isopropylmalate dehydrogenase
LANKIAIQSLGLPNQIVGENRHAHPEKVVYKEYPKVDLTLWHIDALAAYFSSRPERCSAPDIAGRATTGELGAVINEKLLANT